MPEKGKEVFMDKKYKIIGGICGAVCIGGIAAGIFFVRGTGEKEAEELAYVMSVSSMMICREHSVLQEWLSPRRLWKSRKILKEKLKKCW